MVTSPLVNSAEVAGDSESTIYADPLVTVQLTKLYPSGMVTEIGCAVP
jgi:hypothetical protein